MHSTPYEGFLLVNKPIGITSFRIIAILRRILNIKKIGHAGTLDPFASGLLIIAIGKKFTKQLDTFHQYPKTYHFNMVCGIETDTLDSYGKITNTTDTHAQLYDQIVANKAAFIGQITQTPPHYSAKKVAGKKLYEYARKNIDVEIKQHHVTIHDLQLFQDNPKLFTQIRGVMTCSTGTYVRTLVNDLAKSVGNLAYTKDIVRTQIGPYELKNAIGYDDLQKDHIEIIKNKLIYTHE